MVVFVKPKGTCSQCDLTKRRLDAAGLEYAERDLVTDPTALEFVKTLGYLSAPVVVVRDADGLTRHWAGFRPDLIDELTNTVRKAAAA
ncbi:glutaredoxin domain-containing protein [Agromyces sp. NPDC058104]|uniref:glutaredoxin domain-containing protein n=1 Tax=Agromyces sp. NPDC058104 TaxID=3346342 RepID=UPI0036DF97A3